MDALSVAERVRILSGGTALSEESGSAIKSGPPVVSCGNLTPFGKGVRSAEFEVMAAAKMTFLVKIVVDRSVDRGESLEKFSAPKFRHGTLSSLEIPYYDEAT